MESPPKIVQSLAEKLLQKLQWSNSSVPGPDPNPDPDTNPDPGPDSDPDPNPDLVPDPADPAGWDPADPDPNPNPADPAIQYGYIIEATISYYLLTNT